jgi:ferrous iron transport protein B
MIDVARSRGIEIDTSKLSELLGVPVVPTVARTGQGKKDLIEAAVSKAKERKGATPLVISYGDDLDKALGEMEDKIKAQNFLKNLPGPLDCLSTWKTMNRSKGKKLVGSAAKLEDGTKVSVHLERTHDTDPGHNLSHTMAISVLLSRRHSPDYDQADSHLR